MLKTFGLNHGSYFQPPFYQGLQNMNGQPTVRYVYPVNYQNQCQHQMSGDMPSQAYPPCSTQGYGNQYGTSYNSYPVVASQAIDTFVNYSQTTYPVAHSENNMTYSSYPVQYSSGQPQPQQVFYPSTPNIQQGVSNYTFGSSQGHYQTSPPSQQTLSSANGHLQTVPQGGVIPLPGNLTTPTSSQYVYPTIPQFQGQPRVANPQIVQYQNMQNQPGLSTAAGNHSQPIPVIRGLQMNMQMPQIPGVMSQSQNASQGGPVTVSAKGCTYKTSLPKKDSDKQEYVLGGIGSLGSPLVAGPRPLGQIMRPPTQIQAGTQIIERDFTNLLRLEEKMFICKI